MTGLIVRNLKIDFPEYQISSDEFTVPAGEFFSIEAPSGFGKTTLIRAILGFQKTSDGEIILNGRELQGLPPYQREFGVVFQDHLLFSHLNAMDNALFGLRLRKEVNAGAKLRAEAAFESLGLKDRMFAPIPELSGGERQRVSLLRATLFNPQALILDEPLKGLDAHSVEWVTAYLKALIFAKPIPVIWISHQGSNPFPGGRIIGIEQPGHRHFSVN